MHIKWPNKENINLFFLFYFFKTPKIDKTIKEKIKLKKRVKKGNLFDYH